MSESVDALLATGHVYEWRGDYRVEDRPWFLHAQAQDSACTGSWTPPYADPVTGDLVVSFVALLQQPPGAVAIAGTFSVDALH